MAAEAPTVLALAAVVPESRSCGNLHIVFGFQKSRKTAVTTSEKSPAMMSTRLLSMWLAQKNCIEPNEIPTTRIAGVTSNVSFHPTTARTSQKGTIRQVMGRMQIGRAHV